MARGITQTDVWQAADALLLEGARPTIERVRQKIGSGSPNTVSPYLETWFKHLGTRIKDPGAFAAPADVPDPVLAVAKQVWEAAQAEARRDLDQLVSERMTVAVANVEAEKERAAEADRSAFAAAANANRLAGALDERGRELDEARVAHARAQAILEAFSRQNAELQEQLKAKSLQLKAERTKAHEELERAYERAAGAERRAALHIEAERTSRTQADERAQAATHRLDNLQAQLLKQAVAHQDEVGRLLNSLQREQARGQELEEFARGVTAKSAKQAEDLQACKVQLQAAAAQRELAEQLLTALRANSAPRKKASAPR